MNKTWLQTPGQALKRTFKADDTRFMMATGLKVSGISFGINIFIYYFLYQVLRLNSAFFNAHGFPQFAEESPFFDYVIMEASENFPVFLIFHVCLFFIGVYVGWLILRPFRYIGEYAEKVIDHPNTIYQNDDFSNYKLLTRFSEFFFEFLRDARKKSELQSSSIPPQYSGIHKPVLDYVFMLHFGLLLIIIAISSAVFIIENTTAVYQTMSDLAIKMLKDYKATNKYLAEQMFIVDELVFLTVSLIVLFYTMLGLHLYNKVSGAAFGIFSTMRSFMKGNYSSRVHLVGYAHVRESTRKLNKYLDFVQNNFSKQKPKG